MAKSFSEIMAERKAALAAGKTLAPVIVPEDIAKAETPPTEPKPKPTNPFLAALGKKSTPTQASASLEVEKASPIPTVITAANLVTSSSEVKSEAAVEVGAELNISQMEVIRQKIHEMQDMNGFDLKVAADNLKALLLSNPTACQYMLPEDSGLIVRALRRMTGNHQAAALAVAKPKKVAKVKDTPMTAEEIAAAAAEF